jgi:hypothetical protein
VLPLAPFAALVAAGVWAVATALAAGIVTLLAVNGRRIPSLRASMDAGACLRPAGAEHGESGGVRGSGRRHSRQ